jgi:hypothetical protein
VSKEAIDSNHFDNDLMSELTLSLGVPNEPPEDKGEIAYKMMILFGFACLLPWSAILNCLDFFAHNEQDDLPYTVYGFVVNLVQLVAQALTISYGSRFSFTVKLSVMSALLACMLIALPITSKYMPNGIPSLWSVILLLVFIGFTNGVMRAATFDLGGRLPS